MPHITVKGTTFDVDDLPLSGIMLDVPKKAMVRKTGKGLKAGDIVAIGNVTFDGTVTVIGNPHPFKMTDFVGVRHEQPANDNTKTGK